MDKFHTQAEKRCFSLIVWITLRICEQKMWIAAPSDDGRSASSFKNQLRRADHSYHHPVWKLLIASVFIPLHKLAIVLVSHLVQFLQIYTTIKLDWHNFQNISLFSMLFTSWAKLCLHMKTIGWWRAGKVFLTIKIEHKQLDFDRHQLLLTMVLPAHSTETETWSVWEQKHNTSKGKVSDDLYFMGTE